MAEHFNFSIISPEGKLFEDKINYVNLPGSEGRFGVLAEHMNLTSTIKPGITKVRMPDGHVRKFVVCDGITEVNADSCSLLVEKAIAEDDIDHDIFRQKLDEVKEALGKAQSEVEKNSHQVEIEYLEAALSL